MSQCVRRRVKARKISPPKTPLFPGMSHRALSPASNLRWTAFLEARYKSRSVEVKGGLLNADQLAARRYARCTPAAPLPGPPHEAGENLLEEHMPLPLSDNDSANHRPSGIVPSPSPRESETQRTATASGIGAQNRPKRSVSVARLEYHRLSPRDAGHPMLASVYEAWRDGWRSTLEELSVTTAMRSDDFTRQDEIGVLSSGGACVSVTALRWCDLSQPMWLDDTYFSKWPTLAVARLGRRRICISSNTLILPEWRGTRVTARAEMEHAAAPSATVSERIARASLLPGPAPVTAGGELPSASEAAADASPPLSLLTLALATRCFVASSADLLIGVGRNDRAMDRVARTLGFERLATIDVHGVESDILMADKSNIPPPHALVEELWRPRQSS
jgi:hypothetical protein